MSLPCPFEALPSELIEAILAYLPLRPRLLVAALVCKRFRRAVPLTIRKLPSDLWPQVSKQALLSFANLEQLNWSTALPPLCEEDARTIGARVSEIVVSSGSIPMAYFSTSLRSLVLEDTFSQVRAVLDIVATSLTKLHCYSLQLETCFMPQLRDLKAKYINTNVITKHASQLTSLAISVWMFLSTAALSAVAAPQLTSLALTFENGVSSLQASDLFKWVSTLPALTSLDLAFKGDSHPIPTPLLKFLRSLAVSHAMLPSTDDSTYPRLCSLALEGHGEPDIVQIVKLASQLVHLSAPFPVLLSPQFIAAMPTITSIQRLEFRYHHNNQNNHNDLLEQFWKWKLPLLHELYFDYPFMGTVVEQVLTLQCIIQCWPSLDVIYMNFDEADLAHTVPLLCQVFEEAERSGLKELRIGISRGTAHHFLLQLFHNYKWLWIQKM